MIKFILKIIAIVLIVKIFWFMISDGFIKTFRVSNDFAGVCNILALLAIFFLLIFTFGDVIRKNLSK